MTSATEQPARRESLPDAELRPMANAVRALAMDAVEAAKSGHPGMPMGMADVATVLFTEVLAFDPGDPDWPDRDRFVLSAGHGSMLLYALLHLTGYKAVSMDEIRAFRQWMSLTPGHPEYGHTPGVETTTGPLGQGLGNAVGMAMAEMRLRADFGPDLVDHRTYTIAGDGDLMEGISHEAISLAGHLKLDRLTVLFDDNRITIDGGLELSESGDTKKRFEAAGWFVTECDGHDYAAIRAALKAAEAADAPALIACRTIIGFGAPNLQGTSKTHGSPLGADEIAAARKSLGWDHPPFEIPDDIRARWRASAEYGRAARQAWLARCQAGEAGLVDEFVRRNEGRLPDALPAALLRVKKDAKAAGGAVATRKASGNVLDAIAPLVPEFIGGSGDLTGSNNTKAKDATPFSRENPGGTYVYYGIREHAMAAAMNGMALHGGLIPFGGTFLVFSDYCRPSIRLAALMGLRAVFVLTHDSIGLGEDGPTHQPIEHLAALRAIPHLTVFRPADAVETAECWEAALGLDGPSAMALTRQGLPLLRTEEGDENLSAKGGYVLKEADSAPKVTLLATGSEVSLADEARTVLEAEGIGTRLVSIPAWELFEEQDAAYRDAVLGPGTVRIAVEAASPFGWERYTGARENVIGLDHFGASAPYETLYENFGLTRDAIAARARAALAGAEQSAAARTTRT